MSNLNNPPPDIKALEHVMKRALEERRAREARGEPACPCGHDTAEYFKWVGDRGQCCCKGCQIDALDESGGDDEAR